MLAFLLVWLILYIVNSYELTMKLIKLTPHINGSLKSTKHNVLGLHEIDFTDVIAALSRWPAETNIPMQAKYTVKQTRNHKTNKYSV